MKKLSVLTFLILVSLSSAALANAPQKFNFQGQLLDSAGKPVNGAISMTFAIYDDAASTDPANLLWTEAQTVTVTDGVYNVLLGQIEPIDTELSDTTALWLGVTVSGDTEMTPRVELTPGVYDLIMLNAITVKDGNVGIGTINPLGTLHIGNGDNHLGGNNKVQIAFGYNNTNQYSHFIRTRHKGSSESNAIDFYTNDGTQYGVFPTNAILGLSITNGRVGIGTNEPQTKLHIHGYPQIRLNHEDDSRGFWDIRSGNNFYIDDDGVNRVRIDANGRFNIFGTLYVSGGADIPEVFEMVDIETLELGDVVSIDPQNPKHLTKSLIAYDHKVAGIVSNAEQAASIIGVREDGSSDKPVALAGRVLCKVSTENGAIKIGDLLTSSSTPGYAMKATDRDKAFGAVLGKALEAFDGETTGMILVLVALQ